MSDATIHIDTGKNIKYSAAQLRKTRKLSRLDGLNILHVHSGISRKRLLNAKVELFSLERARPVISKLWNSAKSTVETTRVRPLLCNPIVTKIEDTLEGFTDTLLSKLVSLRDKQLEGEKKYLEKELENVKKKIEKKAMTKTLKPMFATAWQYAKVEVAPPMTVSFFQGPAGKKLETAVSKACNNFIAGVESAIKEIDAEEERKIREKAAAIKAEQDRIVNEKAAAMKAEEEKVKAAAKKRAEERKRIAAERRAKEIKKTEALKLAKKAKAPPKKHGRKRGQKRNLENKKDDKKK